MGLIAKGEGKVGVDAKHVSETTNKMVGGKLFKKFVQYL